MKQTISTIKCVIVLLMIFSFARLSFGQNRSSLLITTATLEKNLNDASLIILHYGNKEDFAKEHIPNARLISLKELLVDKENGLKHELPDDKKIEQVIKSWGVNNNSRIVICYGEEKYLVMAARLFFTLDYAGLGDRVSILNGGFVQWKNENRKITSDVLS